MRIAALVALLALGAWLGGCASPPAPVWQKPGAGHEALEEARTECMARAVMAGGTEPGPGNRAEVEAAYRECMEAAGWRSVER